jgi:hypothetical protein
MEEHRHLMDMWELENLIKSPTTSKEDREDAELRLQILKGLIEFCMKMQKETPLCYEDVCTLIVELI